MVRRRILVRDIAEILEHSLTENSVSGNRLVRKLDRPSDYVIK